MKTKIIALLLVLVMATLALTGCTFKYEKKNITKFTSTNKDIINEYLHGIVVDDQDFTENEETRQTKTLEGIRDDVTNAYEKLDLVDSGAVVDNDIVVYRYFYLAGDSSTGLVPFDVDKMLTDSKTASYMDQDKITKAVYEKIKEKTETNPDDYYIPVKTSGTVAAGDFAYVTYTVKDANADEKNVAGYSFVPEEDDGSLAYQLLGKTIAAMFASDSESVITIGDNTYRDITVEFVAPETTLVLDYTLDEDKTVTDVFGTETLLSSGSDLQYYIYLVGRYSIPTIEKEGDHEALVNLLFKKVVDYTSYSIDLFTSTDYKYTYTVGETEKTITVKALAEWLADNTKNTDDVTEALDNTLLATLKADVTAKTTAYETAKAASDASPDDAALKEASDAANTALADATTAYTNAQKEAAVSLILGAKKADDAEANIVEELFKQYYQLKYDTLADAYGYAVNSAVYSAFDWKKIYGAIEITRLPKAAVNNAFENNMNAYRYEYQQNANGEQTTYATVNDYLLAVATEVAQAQDSSAAAVTTTKERKAVLKAEAERNVEDILRVYALANALNEIYGLEGDDKIEFNEANELAYAEYVRYQWSTSSDYTYQIYAQYYDNETVRQLNQQNYTDENYRALVLENAIQNFLFETDDMYVARSFKNLTVTYTQK